MILPLHAPVKFICIIGLTLLVAPFSSYAEQLSGRVIKVADGDTVTVLIAGNKQERIRLSGIDAPEKKQLFGNKSKQALADDIFGKTIVVDWNKRDRYKRIVGKVLLGGEDVNLQQVKRGLAWHYKKYESEQDVTDRSSYANAEYEAQRNRLGLWADPKAIAPWNWRSQKRINRGL